jgi:hypothetical protein
MKAQTQTTPRSGKWPRPSGRHYPSADIPQRRFASRQPVSPARTQNKFTIEEHLRVQQEIEERAHRFWFANGCAQNSALNDWLKAENELLAEFIKTRMKTQPTRLDANKRKISTLSAAITHQPSTTSNPKSTSAFQSSL